MTVIIVSSGVTSSGVDVLDGQVMRVLAGGTTIDTKVESGGEERILPGGEAFGTVISSGGFVDVELAGEARGTVVSGFAAQMVVQGLAINTVVSDFGQVDVECGGRVAIADSLSTTVVIGGQECVGSFGQALNTAVDRTAGLQSVSPLVGRR